jgi:hypothetical protein
MPRSGVSFVSPCPHRQHRNMREQEATSDGFLQASSTSRDGCWSKLEEKQVARKTFDRAYFRFRPMIGNSPALTFFFGRRDIHGYFRNPAQRFKADRSIMWPSSHTLRL